MATTTIKQRRADGAYDLILQLDYTQSVTGNYSDVTWYLKLQALVDRASYHYNYGNSFYLELNGQVLLNTPNLCSIIFDGKELKQLASGTIRVPHNADGSKKLHCKVTFQQTQNLSLANYLIEQSVELPTIPRATVPTLSASSVKVGENVEVLINPASNTFTHTVAYKIGSASGTIKETNSRWLWTVPEELVQQFPNAATGTVVITCTTKSGSTTIGTATTKLTIKPADDMKPMVTAITVEETASLPEEIVGYVKGKSKLKITVEAAGCAGSSVKSYSITVNGTTYTENGITTGLLSASGTNQICVTVTDSRSKKSDSVVKEIEVEDYAAPSLKSVSAYRCAAVEDSSALNTGAVVCVRFTRTISEVGKSNQNVCNISYKKTGDTEWSVVDKTIAEYAMVDDTAFFEADVDSSYDVKLELQDSFANVENSVWVSSAFTLLNLHSSGKGIGIGKVAEIENVVDSAWKLHSNGDIASDGNIEAKGNLASEGSVFVKGDMDSEGSILAKSNITSEGSMVSKGSLSVGSEEYEGKLNVSMQTTLHRIAMHISAAGNAGLYDLAHSKWMLYSTKDGVVALPGTISITGDLQKSGKSIIPVLVGDETNGAIQFPHIQIQICWQSRYLTTTCAAAWGNGYETASKLTFDSWAYAFSDVPTALRLMQGASNVGVLTQSYDPVTKTSPGSVYGFRPSALSTKNTFKCVAIGIGTYE